MKHLIFFVILIFINCNKPSFETNGYIEFVHIGVVNHPYNPLYISLKKIDIQLNGREIADLQEMIGENVKITPQKLKEYINLKYDRLVTDKKTYIYLCEFIFSNKDFYTNNNNQNNNNPGVESYNIHINNAKFSIYYKLKGKYFDDLKTYLSRKRGDIKVIEALSNF